MQYAIVGTAGHVDHGKTELTRALTGVMTDRLQEEQQRGISIKLGFAPLELPDGQKVGLVDVPGHERFIRQMLSGAAGMDLVLLIIAADEGVMPQTREHLDILRLLQVHRAIVVVTKKDLVEDDWLDLVMEEIRETLEDTEYREAPMVAVSAVTGEGIADLRNLLMKELAGLPGRVSSGKPRLPVDRVFSITGFGTVVTGTLWSGTIRQGETLMIMPDGIRTRVRGIQVHGESRQEVQAGQRVALNITDVEVRQITRGSVLVPAGTLEPTFRLDMELYLLPGKKELKQRDRVRVHVGTSEVLGRVYLLDRETLQPGERAMAQIRLESQLVVSRQDRVVIRSYSPMDTIGGGPVLDPLPPRHKRFDKEVLERLATRLSGGPGDLILQKLGGAAAFAVKEIQSGTGLTDEETSRTLTELLEEGEILLLGDQYIRREGAGILREQLQDALQSFHRNYPLRPGLSREEVRSRFFQGYSTRFFNRFLETMEEDGLLLARQSFLAAAGFLPEPSEEQMREIRTMEEAFLQGGFLPPDPAELLAASGKDAAEYYLYLLGQQKLIKINEQIVFATEYYNRARRILIGFLLEKGELKLGDARDLLDSSRKYVLPLLEHFDGLKITRRTGETRIPGPLARKYLDETPESGA